MKNLTKENVICAWFFSGLRDLFFAFQIDSPFRYEPFMNTMGFEKICKSYLLAENSFVYENLEDKEVMEKIDSLAKKWGHDLKGMVKNIKNSIVSQAIESVTSGVYDGYTGKDLIEVMQAAYLECRYPVPKHIHEKFPIKGKPGMNWEPIASSGIEKFCFAFTRKVIIKLKEEFNVPIPKERFNEIITGEAGVRFCNLFLKDTPDEFLE